MSELIHKIKEAVQPHREQIPRTSDTSVSDSDSGPASETMTESSNISPTNPGVMTSTRLGIHGLRDTGTSTALNTSDRKADSSLLMPSTRGFHAGKSVAGAEASVAHGDSISPTNPGMVNSSEPGIHGLRDSGTGVMPGFEEVEKAGSQIHAKAVDEVVRRGGFGGNHSDSANESISPEASAAAAAWGIIPGGQPTEQEQFGTTTTITGGPAVTRSRKS